AGALQVIWGWSKSFPVSIGRPGLRVLAHGIESIVLIPLVVVFGIAWGATGAGGAVLASTAGFCALCTVLLVRIHREPPSAPTALGSTTARKPFVAKLTQDPAFERALRRGRFSGGPVEFQTSGAARALRAARDLELRRAAHVVCPSSFLAGLVRGWGVPAERISVLPNPTPPVPQLPPREPRDRPLLAFAGRMTAPKALDVALEAVAEVPEVDLELAGDGEQRASLEGRAHRLGLDGRVRFLGSLPRGEVLALLRRADAALL